MSTSWSASCARKELGEQRGLVATLYPVKVGGRKVHCEWEDAFSAVEA